MKTDRLTLLVTPDEKAELAARAHVETKPGVALAASGHDKHHSPLALTKDSLKRLFIY